MTSDTRKEICDTYLQGISGPEIAYRFKVSLKVIYGVLRSSSIARRTPKEQSVYRLLFKEPTFDLPVKLTESQSQITLAAIMLYLAEGAKTGTTVDFTNGSGPILKVFLRFLREVCNINEIKLRLYLYCFSNQHPQRLIEYWCRYLQVYRHQFTKPYVRVITSRHTRIMEHGVLHIRYSDKRLLETILSLGEEMLKNLVK